MSRSNRSAEVRQEARAKLLRMRQERLKRRPGATVTVATPEADAPEEMESETVGAFSEDLVAEQEATEIEHDIAVETDLNTALAEDEVIEAEIEMPVEDIEDEASGDDIEPEDEASSPESLAAPEDNADEELGDGSIDETAPVDSDLSTIPGAGPGLIWMLEQASVHSLEDLAGADAEALKEALGPVGRIIDVDGLIEFAGGPNSTPLTKAS